MAAPALPGATPLAESSAGDAALGSVERAFVVALCPPPSGDSASSNEGAQLARAVSRSVQAIDNAAAAVSRSGATVRVSPDCSRGHWDVSGTGSACEPPVPVVASHADVVRGPPRTRGARIHGASIRFDQCH